MNNILLLKQISKKKCEGKYTQELTHLEAVRKQHCYFLNFHTENMCCLLNISGIFCTAAVQVSLLVLQIRCDPFLPWTEFPEQTHKKCSQHLYILYRKATNDVPQ